MRRTHFSMLLSADSLHYSLSQLRSVLDDIQVKAMKTGMLYDAASIHSVVKVLQAHYSSNGEPASISTLR